MAKTDKKTQGLIDALSSKGEPDQKEAKKSTAVARIDTSAMLAAMCEKGGIKPPGNFQGTSRPVAEKIKIIREMAIFEMPDESTRDNVTGTVIYCHTPRAMWETEESKMPECSSKWGIEPDYSVIEPLGENCLTCEKARFGSGKNGAQACTDSRRLFFLMDGENEKIPCIITLPPTSIKAWDTYATKLEKEGKRFFEVMTTIALKKEKGNGFTYSVAIMSHETIEDHYNNDLSLIGPRCGEIVRLLGEVSKMEDIDITREENPTTPESTETAGEATEETREETPDEPQGQDGKEA